MLVLNQSFEIMIGLRGQNTAFADRSKGALNVKTRKKEKEKEKEKTEKAACSCKSTNTGASVGYLTHPRSKLP